MTVYNNEIRIGRFTSSKIAALLAEGKAKGSMGKPALTYIEDKKMERQMGLLLAAETTSHPFSWGKAAEIRIFEILDSSYEHVSQETLQHSEISCWCGSPDAIKHEGDGIISVEFKCPVTRKSYMTAYNCKDITELREKHTDGDDYYWQVVSNAILLGTNKCELIWYAPYQKELQEIRELCQTSDKLPLDKMYQFMWISNSSDDELIYLNNDERVKNIKIFRFEIPQTDMDLLKEKILAAQKLLEAPEAEVVESKPLEPGEQAALILPK